MNKFLLLAIGLVLAAPVTADTLWRQYGFNAAHTSYNNTETTLNVSNVSRLTLLWKSNTFKASGFVRSVPTLGFDAQSFSTPTDEPTRWRSKAVRGAGDGYPVPA